MDDPNCGTGGPQRLAAFRPQWEDAVRALARAQRDVTLVPAAEQRTRGYRVSWVDEDGALQSRDLAVGDHLVVGRHTQADIRLRDLDVSLRHAMLLAIERDPGEVELHVHDLGTSLGFCVDGDETPCARHVSSDLVTLSIHGHAFGVAPYRSGAAHGARVSKEEVAARPSWARQREPGAAFGTYARSIVDVLPRRDAWARVVVRSRSGTFRASVSRADLEYPVLVGRYERCMGAQAESLPNEISRVHAALLADGDDVLVLDTASTNGLTHRGEPVRSVRVSDAVELELCEGVTLQVERVRR